MLLTVFRKKLIKSQRFQNCIMSKFALINIANTFPKKNKTSAKTIVLTGSFLHRFWMVFGSLFVYNVTYERNHPKGGYQYSSSHPVSHQ